MKSALQTHHVTLIVNNETTMVDTGRMSRVTLHYNILTPKNSVLQGFFRLFCSVNRVLKKRQ